MRYVLVLLLCATTSLAAPAPKDRPFDKEAAVGIWKYKWGAMEEGFICLYADGTYHAKHQAKEPAFWHGEWNIHNGVYEFRERRIDGDGSAGSFNCRYEMKVKVTSRNDWIADAGTWNIRFHDKTPFAKD